jgi:hypothetical protein
VKKTPIIIFLSSILFISCATLSYKLRRRAYLNHREVDLYLPKNYIIGGLRLNQIHNGQKQGWWLCHEKKGFRAASFFGHDSIIAHGKLYVNKPLIIRSSYFYFVLETNSMVNCNGDIPIPANFHKTNLWYQCRPLPPESFSKNVDFYLTYTLNEDSITRRGFIFDKKKSLISYYEQIGNDHMNQYFLGSHGRTTISLFGSRDHYFELNDSNVTMRVYEDSVVYNLSEMR